MCANQAAGCLGTPYCIEYCIVYLCSIGFSYPATVHTDTLPVITVQTATEYSMYAVAEWPTGRPTVRIQESTCTTQRLYTYSPGTRTVLYCMYSCTHLTRHSIEYVAPARPLRSLWRSTNLPPALPKVLRSTVGPSRTRARAFTEQRDEPTSTASKASVRLLNLRI